MNNAYTIEHRTASDYERRYRRHLDDTEITVSRFRGMYHVAVYVKGAHRIVGGFAAGGKGEHHFADGVAGCTAYARRSWVHWAATQIAPDDLPQNDT